MRFSAASSADNLELEVNDDGVVSATDDRTITINAAGGCGSGQVCDTFTEGGSSDIPITSHTPDTGTGWTEVFDDTSAGTDLEVNAPSDRLRSGYSSTETGNGQAYTAQPDPTTPDQDVSVTIAVVHNDNSPRLWGLFARRTDNDNFYHVQIVPDTYTGQDTFTLWRYVGGVATKLGGYNETTITAGMVVKLEIRDAAKKVYIDGTERISSTDNSLTAAGTWGIYWGNFNGAGDGGDHPRGWYADDFLAEEPSSDSSDPTDYTQDANIVSWWYLDESAGTRYDGSGTNSNDLADNNTVTSYSTTNQSVKEGAAAASFAIANSETLTITDASQTGLDITDNITMVAWMRPATLANDMGIFGKTDADPNRSYYLYIEKDGPMLKAKLSSTGTNWTEPYGATTLATDTWYHVALVYNGTDIRLYLNGSLDENGANNPISYSNGIYDGSAAFAIGSRGNVNDFFDGQIDEVAIFNRALAADEIQEIYEKGLNGVTRMRPDAAQPPVPYFGRSIGEDTGTVYGTGTVTLNEGSRRATFSGAALPNDVGEGDVLTIGGSTTYYIASRKATSEVIVQEANISGADHSSASYTITRAYSGANQSPFQNGTNGWEDDRDGDLVTDDAIQRGVVYKDSDGVFAFAANAYIDGSTTNSSHFMWLLAHGTALHSGTAGTGVVLDANASTGIIDVNDPYTRVEWLEMTNFSGDNGHNAVRVAEVSGVLLQNLLIYDFEDATYSVAGIQLGGAGNANVTIRNCIIYDGDQGIRGDETTDTVTIQNCTIYGMTGGHGVYEDSSTFTVSNTISMNNSGSDFDIVNGSQSYNISQDAAGSGGATGTGSMAGRTATANASPGTGDWVIFSNITAGSENFHLQDSSENDALDSGTDLSSSFTDDIDGDTRPTGVGTWDIGADELGSGGGAGTATISSAANQSFTVGDGITAISTITITDASTPTITDTNDIRIHIPSGFNMEWDTNDTDVTFGGSASGNVTGVSFPSSKELIIAVSTSFDADDTLTISDLGFKNFSAASSADNLELEIYNDDAVTDTDDKTITINAAGCGNGKFTYRRQITIYHSQVVGESADSVDLTNFPILVHLTGSWLRTTANDETNGRIEHAQGWDIIFRDTDEENQIFHEIHFYDGGAVQVNTGPG